MLLQALVCIPCISLGLKFLGFRRVYQFLGRWSSSQEVLLENQPGQIERISDVVGKAAWRGFFPVTCLPRSLCLWFFLRRNRILAELRIGVRRGDQGLAAHAWVEVGQLPLLDHAQIADEFIPVPLDRIESNMRWS